MLARLQEPGTQVALASDIGVSESTISRFKNEQLETFCSVIAHLGLKVVPAEMRCFSTDEIQALLVFSKAHLQTISRADQLRWE